MREILLKNAAGPLGAVCDPTDPNAVAAAIDSILRLNANDRAALRRRCIEAAAATWNWEAQAEKLTDLYRSITSVPAQS
jgi:glycosyltransferase involved in cell wall biosynthesis